MYGGGGIGGGCVCVGGGGGKKKSIINLHKICKLESSTYAFMVMTDGSTSSPTFCVHEIAVFNE